MAVRRGVLDVLGLKGAVLPVTSPTTPKAPEKTILRAELDAGPSSRRSWLRAVLAAVVVGVVSAGSASPALGEDTCANASVRVQNNSTHLPDCRAFEMVSQPYKEGFGATLDGFTDDGGTVAYQSLGSFAGNLQGNFKNVYHAVRSSAGWGTSALAQPDVQYNSLDTTIQAESTDLRRSLWLMSRRDLPGDPFGFWLRDPDGAFTRVGDASAGAGAGGTAVVPFPVGASDDLSHFVFRYGSAGSAAATALWEYVVNGGGVRRAVSVDNFGVLSSLETCPHDVSSDGRVIVFTLGCNSSGTPRVMARVAGSATVAVSGSECTRGPGDLGGDCNGVSAAAYAGAAADGSRVFFTTSQQLVNGDTNATDDLYACDIPPGVPAPVGTENACASLTQVSGTASNAQVQNVVAVSEDGSRAYFVAQGVLASNLGVGDVGASAGVSNLYLWERDSAHPAGETRFVARLAVSDLLRAHMTPDNRYLLFQTANSLVTEGPDADTDGGATDVYRYDARTGSIVRASTSVAGGGGNAAIDASINVVPSMSSDGSTVIFDTPEGLSQSDTNGSLDVYAWHDGHVSSISLRGGSTEGITPSGRDIFFNSAAPLVAADGDVISDVYDARVGGGFEPAQTTSCSGAECQGQPSQPPGLAGPLVPASGNGERVVAPSVFSLRAVSAAQRRALAATGKVSLTVTANAAGTVRARATATVGGRSVTVGSARRTLAVPGKVAVTLTLAKKARAQLAARGRLTVRVAVSHSKVALDRSVTLKLVKTKAAKKSGKRLPGQRSVTGGGRS